jgi:hypothetical protein
MPSLSLLQFIARAKAVQGKKHDYLAMTLDFTTPEVLKINMKSCIKKMLEDFPENLDGKNKCQMPTSIKLQKDKMKIFHTFVGKGIFLCKQARQDMLPGIVYFATRVQKPNKSNWKKLVRLMNYL